MKVLHLSTSDLGGGAARAAYRLHQGLRKKGIESQMLVARKLSDDPTVIRIRAPRTIIGRFRWNLRHQRLSRSINPYSAYLAKHSRPFSDDRSAFGISVLEQMPTHDIINLHWITRFIDHESFFKNIPSNTPIVWRLSDENPFTGGCHYSEDCSRYTAFCGSCPQLGSSDYKDLSYQIFQRKQNAFSYIDPKRIHIIAQSNWIAKAVQNSSLFSAFPMSVIHSGVDTVTFRWLNKTAARDVLGIPANSKVLLFVAQDLDFPRKGFRELCNAISQLLHIDSISLLTVGKGEPEVQVPIPHHRLGYVANERLLSIVYNAADILVVPSLNDNLPNVILEALSCGVPVIGHDVGGIPDVVRNGETGLLVESLAPHVLAGSIEELLTNDELRLKLSENAGKCARNEFSREIQVQRYTKLYESMLRMK